MGFNKFIAHTTGWFCNGRFACILDVFKAQISNNWFSFQIMLSMTDLQELFYHLHVLGHTLYTDNAIFLSMLSE